MSEVIEYKVPKKTIRVTIADKSFEMRLPLRSEAKKINEELASCDPKDAEKLVDDFMKTLGLTEEALDTIDNDEFLDLFSFVMGGGKKK